MPRSSKLVEEDGEYSLYSVVLFRRVADSFKANARTRGFQARLPSRRRRLCVRLVSYGVVIELQD